jgi:hypothetical protein
VSDACGAGQNAAFLLVHAPLLGPLSWQPCTESLRASGCRVAVADLRPAVRAARGWWRRATDLCVAGAPGPRPVVVGHSGAGVLLPLVSAALDARAVVFVDALVPAPAGATCAADAILEFVARFPSDEPLPRWSSWWPDEAMAELLPDAAMRTAPAADEPRLPRDFCTEPVPVPDGWEPASVSYVQLSAAYERDATTAAERGWRVVRLPGHHLSPMTEPCPVADALIEAAG